MYCKKHRAILSIKACLLRQDIAEEKKKGGENLTSFSKCFNCGYGKKIRMNPDPKLDKDVRAIMREYLPKPIKHDLEIIKPSKHNLRKIVKYKLGE